MCNHHIGCHGEGDAHTGAFWADGLLPMRHLSLFLIVSAGQATWTSLRCPVWAAQSGQGGH